MPDIFTPLQIKGKTLKNRIVMGAAERVGFTYEDGLMGEDVIQEYEALAQNNIGLMITQSLVISPEDAVACGFPVPGIYKPEHVMPLKRIVDAAHKNGSVLIAQLGIAIRYSPHWSTKNIEDLLARYLYSAKLCMEAGVDGIEIHGAHNVTLNHTLAYTTQRRDPQWRSLSRMRSSRKRSSGS